MALLKNPEHLTEKQSRKLALIAQVNDPLYCAYLLKKELRIIFGCPTSRPRSEPIDVMVSADCPWSAGIGRAG